MDFSKKGKALTEFFEGRRHEAYQDSASIWTIGIGHTGGVKQGAVISDAKIDELFQKDIEKSIARLNKVINRPMTQGEFDALVNQAFNLRSFEKLGSYFNNDKNLWKEKTRLYVYDVKGNLLKGLKIRRISEVLLAEDREWKEFAIWAQRKTTTNQMILEKEKELFSQPYVKLENQIAEIDALSIPKPVMDMMDKSVENFKKGIVGKV